MLTLYAKRLDGQSFMNYYQREALSLKQFEILLPIKNIICYLFEIPT